MTRPYPSGLRFLFAACCAASLLLAGTAWSAAATGKVANVRGSKQDGFSRIIFSWPNDVNISARVDGTRLAMTFNRKSDFDFTALKSSLPDTVLGAEMTPDGRTVMLTLDRAYRIRTFTSDRMAGVDLLKPAQTPAAAAEEASSPAKAQRATPVRQADAKLKHSKATQIAQRIISKKEPGISAKSGKELRQTAPTPPASPPPTKTVVAPVAQPLAELAPSAGAEEAPAPTPAPAVKTTEALSELAPAAIPVAGPADSTDNILSIMPSMGKEGTVLRFAFSERTASAVFTRAGHIWIVFNRPVNVNLDLLQNQLPNQTGEAERLDVPSATVIRIPFEGESGTSILKDSGSFAWQITLSSQPQPTTNMPKININTDPSVKPHLLVEALETSEPLTIKDPTVGDELVIVPSHKSGEGIMPGREFVDFALLESTQGLVVQKIADDTTVLPSRNGIRIATRKGALLSPGLPQPEVAATSANDPSSLTLFPYEAWKPGRPDAFDLEVRKLFVEMAMAKTPMEKNGLRLRVTHLYLGQGLGIETLGMLQEIRRTDPAFYIARKLNALSGAANFISYRFGDAAQNFAALELNNNEEIAFWRQMISELLGSDQERFDYLAMSKYISKYPPLFRQRLAIVAADRSIAAKEYTKALKIIDSVQDPETLEGIKPYINFLLGKISAETGQQAAAIEVWKELAENYANPYVRASAEFSLITQQMQTGAIGNDETIKRMERLRIAWRGDGLELSVLMLLGNLYDDKQDYANALNAWRDVVTVFPNTEQSHEVSRRMQAAFLTLFKNDDSNKLSALDSLALFYEYRDLTPVGEEGDRVVHLLADKLVDVDLLEQAALLLDQQMRTRQQKDGRSRTGAKLALVRLLNRQPEKALQALELSAYGDNPDDLRLTRDRLAAQALTEIGHYDEAIRLLAHDNSVEADTLRVQAYWKQKDWANLISTAEATLKKRDDPTAPVTAIETDILLKLALSYIFEKDGVQLQYLRDYFGPLLAENPNQPVFNFLTQADITPDPENFEEAMQLVDATRSFFESYRTHLKEPKPASAVN